MSEQKLRQEAVRRRLAGDSPTEVAEALNRTARWVRKWVARHAEDGLAAAWHESEGVLPSPRSHRGHPFNSFQPTTSTYPANASPSPKTKPTSTSPRSSKSDPAS